MTKTKRGSRPSPRRIRFHGQNVEFSREIKYLVADETAAAVVGKGSRGPVPRDESWEGDIVEVLNLFDDAARGVEGYEWLVTPNPVLDNRRPLELIQDGKAEEVVQATERLLSPSDGH